MAPGAIAAVVLGALFGAAALAVVAAYGVRRASLRRRQRLYNGGSGDSAHGGGGHLEMKVERGRIQVFGPAGPPPDMTATAVVALPAGALNGPRI
jgi:hypothetical protein